MIFEQEPSQLLNAILPLYINGQPNAFHPEARIELERKEGVDSEGSIL